MIQVPEEKLSVIGEIVQMLHNASLLLDDIGILSKNHINNRKWKINH